MELSEGNFFWGVWATNMIFRNKSFAIFLQKNVKLPFFCGNLKVFLLDRQTANFFKLLHWRKQKSINLAKTLFWSILRLFSVNSLTIDSTPCTPYSICEMIISVTVELMLERISAREEVASLGEGFITTGGGLNIKIQDPHPVPKTHWTVPPINNEETSAFYSRSFVNNFHETLFRKGSNCYHS